MANLGRPTKYDEKYCSELIEYFDVEPYEEKTKTVKTKKGEVFEITEDVASDFRSLAGFAIKIGVHRDTLHEWSKQHPNFSDAIKRVKDFQENYLLVNGLKGTIDRVFGIFTAKNFTDLKDKQIVEHEGEVTNNVKVSKVDLDTRIEQLKANE